MNTDVLIKFVRGLAKPAGYRSKGVLFWKRHDELTTIFHLQRSQWSPTFYVNFGVTPNVMVIKPAPPGNGLWPLFDRADSFDGPHRDDFSKLACDRDDDLPVEELGGAFRWLMTWLDKTLGDSAIVRAAIIAKIKPHTGQPIGHDEDWILQDWAKGQLKKPHEYYRPPYGGRYYNSPE